MMGKVSLSARLVEEGAPACQNMWSSSPSSTRFMRGSFPEQEFPFPIFMVASFIMVGQVDEGAPARQHMWSSSPSPIRLLQGSFPKPELPFSIIVMFSFMIDHSSMTTCVFLLPLLSIAYNLRWK